MQQARNTEPATDVAIEAHIRAERPPRGFWGLFNLSFGFLGIQFAFALQGANVSRIFQSLGAKIEDLPILWIAAPLTGLIVQPLIGHYSDRTWSRRFGRRRPYFFAGAVLTCVALVAMPHARVLWVAASLLWLMDGSINLAMEPFRAFVGDLLARAQRTSGYAFQTVFIGVGAVAASLAPLGFHRWFELMSTPGADGGAAPSVRWAFYAGAAALAVAVGWTVLTTAELPPEPRARRAGVGTGPVFLARAAWPWLAAGAVIAVGTRALGLEPSLYVLAGCCLGFGAARLWTRARNAAGRSVGAVGDLLRDFDTMPGVMRRLAVVQFCAWFALFVLWIYATPVVTARAFGASGPADPAYAAGADWVGVMFAVYNGVAALAAFALPAVARRIGQPRAYSATLIVGAAAFAGLFLVREPDWLLLPMVGIGVAWAGVLTLPYAILSNEAPPERLGAYMGLFNIFVTLPQLVVSSVMGTVVGLLAPGHAEVAMLCAATLMLTGAVAAARLRRTDGGSLLPASSSRRLQ